MKKYYLTIALISCGIHLNAQQNTVASGNDATGTGGSVSITIGQIDYQSNSGTGGTINQGVQQPYEIFDVISVNELDLLITTIFPNPTNGIVQLTVSSIENNLEYALYDLSGRRLQQQLIDANQTNIDLSKLAAGEYLLQVSNQSQQQKTLKIIKH